MTDYRVYQESGPGAVEAKLERLAVAMESVARGACAPARGSDGRYELTAWLDAQRNGKVYGVRIPKYGYTTATACVKVGANAGLSVAPSTASSAGPDDYRREFPFMVWDVNGGADADGLPYVTAIDGYDTSFDRHGGNGNVWVMAPLLWWRFSEESDYLLLEISDSPKEGFEPQPGAKLPDGSIRPYMLYAKYAGGTYDGKYASVSGVPFRNYDVSHNTLITLASAVGAGYGGKSIADDWYVKVMFLMKYATKNSQSVFAGCTSYNYQYYPTVAEKGVSRVIISKANAANLLVGSSCMFGTRANNDSDRGQATIHNIFGSLKISKIVDYDASNSAVYFDTDQTWDTATTYMLSTAPWASGALDDVQGVDGSITAAGKTNGKEPFLLQGIECMLGAYEVVGDVMLYTHSTGVDVLVNYDSKNEKAAFDANVYADTGVDLSKGSAAGWQYCKDVASAGGFLVPQGTGASTSTGMCDGHYAEAPTATDYREFLGLGALDDGANAGLWCGSSGDALSYAWWLIGSRLSVTGRTAA